MNHKLVPIRNTIAAPASNASTNNDGEKYAKNYNYDGKPTFYWRHLISLFYACVGTAIQIIGAEWGNRLTNSLRSLIKT